MTQTASSHPQESVADRAMNVLHDVHGQMKPKLRGLVHAWSAIPVGIMGFVLLIMTPDLGARWAVGVYVLAVTGMLTASACYHRLKVSEKARNYLRRLDHSMIGVAVAGTYTPVLVLVLDGSLQLGLMFLLWSGTLAAMLISFAWPSAPSWLRALVYVAQGVSGVAVMPWVLENAGAAPFVLIIVGGVLYGIGAIAYATHRPNPWPRVFGFHEVFHSLVVSAAVTHMVAVGLVVAALT